MVIIIIYDKSRVGVRKKITLFVITGTKVHSQLNLR